MRRRLLAAALLFSLAGVFRLSAEDAPAGSDLPAADANSPVSASEPDAQAAPAGSDLPEARIVPASEVLPAAYRAEKKPPENFFRRFEIIALGSYPITMLYTSFSFSMASYIQHDFSATYAPWPFNSSSVDTTTTEEHLTRMGVAACVSLAIAGVDAVIRAIQEGRSAAGELDSAVGPH